MSMTFTFTAPEGTTLGATDVESSGVNFTFSTASSGAQGAKGDKGDKGEQGVQGEQGPAGTTDYNDLQNKPAIPTKTSDLTNDSNYITDADYVHTDNNYTTPEKEKLAEIAAGAQVNVIEIVQVNGTALAVSNKAVNIDLTDYATKSDISHVYKYMGSVATYADLPTTGQEIGDTYNIVAADATHGIKAGDNVAWNGTEWDNLGGTVDLSSYYTKTEVDALLLQKADGANVYTKTETDSLLSGKISITDYATDAEAISGAATNKAISPASLKATLLAYDAENFCGAQFDGVHSAGTKLGKAVNWNFSPSTESVAGTDDYRQYEPFNQQRFLVKPDGNGIAQITDWEGTAEFENHLYDEAYGADCFVKFPLAYVKRIIDSNGVDSKYVSDKYLPGYTIPKCFISGVKVLPFIGITCRPWQNDGAGGITTRIGHFPKYNITENNFETLARAKGLLNLGQNEVNYLQHLGSIKYANLNWQTAVDYGIDDAFYSRSGCTVAQTSADSIIVDNANAAYISVGDYIGFANPSYQPHGLPVTAITDYDSDNKRITVAGMSLTSVVGNTGFYRMCLAGGMTDTVLGLDGYDSTKTIHKRSVKTLGIEDLFGNIWKILGGACRIGTDIYINSSPDSAYTWPTDADNAIALGWTKLNGSIPVSGGYVKTFIYDNAFPLTSYPATVGGDSANPVGDYFYTNTNTVPCVVLLGGDLNYGVFAGAFFSYVDRSVGAAYWNYGGLGVFKNTL